MSYQVGILRNYTICLDPGHGGSDPGAVDGKGVNDKLHTLEKDINLKVSLLLLSKLNKLGAKVILTRKNDVYPSLSQRYAIANNYDSDIFISVHCNAGPNAANGIETLYKKDKLLADLIHNELIAATKTNDRGLKLRTDLAVLNGTKMPAVLVELGFITNDNEEIKLNNPAYQNLLTEAIVKGIVKYKVKKLGV